MMKGKFAIGIGIIIILLSVLVIAEEDIIRIDSDGKKELYDGELKLNYCSSYSGNVLHVNERRVDSPGVNDLIDVTVKKPDKIGYIKVYRVTVINIETPNIMEGPTIIGIIQKGDDVSSCNSGYIKLKTEIIPKCGDNICNGNENCKTCSDCGSCIPFCGDGVCQDFEACNTCDEDCGECERVCGDGKCSYDEPTTCPEDCDSSLHLPSESGGGGSTESDGESRGGGRTDSTQLDYVCGDNTCDVNEACCIDCSCGDNFECVNNECVVISQSTQDNKSSESLSSNLTVVKISDLEEENQTDDIKHEEDTQIQPQEKVNIIHVIVNWFKSWFR